MTPSDWSNLVLTVCTVLGIGALGYVLVMGVRYFFTEPDNYSTRKRCRTNLFKTPR